MLDTIRTARGVMRSLGIYYGRRQRLRSPAMDQLHRRFVKRGDLVRTGEQIGYVGDTGNARTVGCHLHFELRSRKDRLLDPAPFLLQMADYQHLATSVTGELAGDPSALALAASLHPTAAICGTPTQRALELIRELEGMERGRYSGPVGWVDGRGNGEWGIALRCGEIEGRWRYVSTS